MGRLLLEFVHKLFTAVLGVGLGMAALWYSQNHHLNMWIAGAAGAAIALVASALFHPAAFLWRHRRRPTVVADDAR